MQRQFPTAPIAGVGAVVLDAEQRVLLVRRGQEPLLGEWSLPGGALELGERLEEGVRREVSEETGLDVEPEEIVAVFDHISLAGEDPAIADRDQGIEAAGDRLGLVAVPSRRARALAGRLDECEPA